MCCQLEAVFEDTHTHRCIVTPSVGQPHQTHSWIPGWLWHDALNLSTSHRFTTHITYPGWQDPDKSQNPIPPTSPGGEGASPPRENYPRSEIMRHQGKEGRGQPPRCSPVWPLAAPALAKPCWNAAPLSLKVQNTYARHTRTPQKTFSISTHLCLTPSLAGRQAPTTGSFHRKAGGFLTLPKAPRGHPLQLRSAWPKATGSPQTHRSVPKVLQALPFVE